jgi:hypothetical protein
MSSFLRFFLRQTQFRERARIEFVYYEWEYRKTSLKRFMQTVKSLLEWILLQFIIDLIKLNYAIL